MKNPQAFPLSGSYEDEHPDIIVLLQEGMTLLDYFAGQALIGEGTVVNNEKTASRCYGVAEAMLKERERRMK